jgi:hypothetical protein
MTVGQNNILFENGIVEAAGSIGITLRFTVNVWGTNVVFVKEIDGF